MTLATFAEPFPAGGLPYTLPFTLGANADHDDFAAWAREVREYRIERANDRPIIKLYDGELIYRGTVYGEIAGHMEPTVNETGAISLRLPIDLDEIGRASGRESG